jgi:transposase
VYPDRIAAACVAHAGASSTNWPRPASPLAEEAIRRIARIYEIEAGLEACATTSGRQVRQQLAKPLWKQAQVWLRTGAAARRRRRPDGRGHRLHAQPLDALTRHLDDGAVPIDNNHLERQIKPWAMGRKAWMFVGSELGRAARGDGDEPGAVGQAPRTRPLGLPA